MRPFATFIVGVAGIAVWSMLVLMAGRSVGHEETAGFEIEDMPTEWADPAIAPDGNTDEPLDAAAELPTEAGTTAEVTRMPLDEAGPLPEAAAGNSVRPVTPELFASPLSEPGAPLERIEPRAPLTPEPVKAERVKVALLPRPESVGAGLIAFGQRNLKLAEITPTDRMRVCPTANGSDWPCGMVARTQQRLFLRNRTLSCDMDSTEWEGTIEAHCSVADTDIASWLAENGWVEAPAGSPLAGLVEKARAERRGLFGDDPR